MKIEHPEMFAETTTTKKPNLYWSGKYYVSYLVELITALCECNAITDKEMNPVPFSELARCFEQVFHVELKRVYRKRDDVLMRNTHKTPFLDLLKASLLKKM